MNYWITRRYERQMLILVQFLETLGTTCYFNDECTRLDVEVVDEFVMQITRKRDDYEMHISGMVMSLPTFGTRSFWNDIEKIVRYFVVSRQNLLDSFGI